MPQQAAEGQEEGDHFGTQNNRRHPAHRFGTHPDNKCDAQRKAQPSQTRRNVQRHLRKGVMQNRTACRDVRVGQDVKHKRDGKAIHQVPAFTQQIFRDGVEAGANAVVQVGFKDHQP